MADEDLGTGSVTIEITDVQANRSLDKLAERIEQVLDRAARTAAVRIDRHISRAIRRLSPARIEIEADLSRFNRMIHGIDDLSDVEVKAVPKVVAREWQRQIQEAIAGIEVKVKVVPDVSGFDRRIREITTPTIRADVETRVDNDRLTRALSSIGQAATGALGSVGSLAGSALRIGALGIAAAGAAQSFVALGAALAPAAGIIAAAPAAILGFAGALGALKLATAGVGDAFGAALSGDTKKFEQAMEGLSPAAQKAAREVKALKPAFDDLKNSVQDALFKPLEGQITAVAKALAGPLKSGLTAISAEFGRGAVNAASFLKTAEGASALTSILNASKAAVAGLADGASDLVSGFLRAGSVVANAFGQRLGDAIGSTADRLGQFLSNAAADGRLVTLVDNAITVFKQLGSIASNVGGILSGIFQAANAVGGGFLGNLQTITQTFETFVKSAAGQTALQNVFSTLATVAANLGPIITSLATQLGKLAPAIAPVLNTLGPAIVTAINALGPALQAILPGVQALVEGLSDGFEQIANSGALTQIGQAIGQIGQAIGPILPIAGQLIGTLGAALAPVLSALAPVLDAVVGAIGELVNAVSPLLVVAGQLIAQIGPILTPIVAALGKVFASLAPLIQTVADTLGAVFGPILAVLPGLIQPFLDQVTNLIGALLPPLNDILVQLQPSLIEVSQAFVSVAEALIPVLTQVAALSAKILTALVPVLGPLIDLVAKLAAIFAGELAKILTTVVVPALNTVAAFLRGDFSGAFRSLGDLVKGILGAIKDQFVELPVKILTALGNLGSLLVSAGEDLIRGLIVGIKNLAGRVVDAAKDVVGDAIAGAKNLLGIHSPSKVFFEIGQQTGQGLVNGLDAMGQRVGQAASDMAAAAVSPFADLAVNGPTVNGVNTGSALAAITQPFGAGTVNPIDTFRSTRQASVQGASGGTGGATIQNTFNITEVGNADATAERVVNRMVAAAGVFL